MDIREELFKMQDLAYREFSSKLIPTIDAASVIGIRTPELRKFARLLLKKGEVSAFLDGLPHQYFDENQLHAFIISGLKDYDECIKRLNSFLPYVDNWATCDQMSPKIFKKNHEKLLSEIDRWLDSEKTYTIRFGIGMLMEHFLDEDFKDEYPERVSKVRSEEYYVNMMIAWYFATGLAKQYDAFIPYIEEGRLTVWTHNKTIQKAVESNRITPEQKAYLKTLKRKK